MESEYSDSIRKYRKILIVEDDQGLQHLIIRNLVKEGFDCLGFSTGKEILDYLLSGQEGILLLDHKLPDMSGKEIIEKMVVLGLKRPFIIMTGQGDEKLAVDMMKRGASDYLIKDIELLDILPGVLERVLINLKTENRLKETEEYLKIAMDKNTALLNSLPDLMFVIDSEYRFIDFFPKTNPDIVLFFQPKDFIGKKIDVLFESSIAEHIRSKIDLVFKNKTLEIADYILEKDGEKKYFESRFLIFGNNEVLVIERNITEQKKSEIEKQLLQQQLMQSQKMDSIGRLAGGVAHDFNNMLTGIIGSAQLLKMTCDLSAKGKEFTDLILKSSERAADLTAKLLTFSRRNLVTKQNVNIHEMILDTISILNRSVDKKIIIENQLEAADFRVTGDSALIHNAFINMGINASHAMPEGGRITFSTHNVLLDEHYCQNSLFDLVAGNYIDIKVKDTGSGISPENLTKIFDPFFTTKEQGKGTGLGLSIVYGLVRDSKGAITVESRVNNGTIFHIYFPLSDLETKEKADENEVFKKEGLILLVDDEEMVRLVCRELLYSLGFKVLTAVNGLDALNVFNKHIDQIDFVILDMIMPVMNGKEAFYRMKELRNDVKIVIASGFFNENDINELKQKGLFNVIEKPFKLEDLSLILCN